MPAYISSEDHKENNKPQYNYGHENYDQPNNLLEQMEWEEDMDSVVLNYFISAYSKMIEDCIPKSKPGKQKKNKYLTLIAMKYKYKKYQQWKTFTETDD